MVLQIRIFFFLKTVDTSSAAIEVDEGVLMFSLGCALLHTVIEFTLIILEAKACKTKLMHYCIVCLNARFGWIPFDHILYSSGNVKEEDRKLNFETLKVSCHQMEFSFADQTVPILQNVIINEPVIRDCNKRRFTLILGSSIDNLSFENLRILCTYGNNRVNLIFDNINLQKILSVNQEQMKEILCPQLKQNEYCFTQQIVYDRQY